MGLDFQFLKYPDKYVTLFRVTVYKCSCNQGYTGNGIQCFDSNGNLSQNPNEVFSKCSLKKCRGKDTEYKKT